MSNPIKYWTLVILLLSLLSVSATMPPAQKAVHQQAVCSMESTAMAQPGKLNSIECTSNGNIATIRAGIDADATILNSPTTKPNSLRKIALKNMIGCWGVIQVLSILANAIKRVIPVAIQPFVQKDLLPLQAAICGVWCLYMVYTEGYKTFQLKFSPLVVKRAFGLSNNLSVVNCLFAGPYSMGLFGATRKRMIVSWSVTLGVFALVRIVKKLPYPWRSIVDAGVVLGLGYGALAMCFQTVRAMLGYIPDVDECLPLKAEQSSKKSS